MPKFSKPSLDQLSTCHPNLQAVFNEVIKFRDCKILEGHRNEEAQHQAFITGKSKLDWPNGNHNKFPSDAVDAAPYPVEFPLPTDSAQVKQKKLMQFCVFAGYVLATADQLGIPLRWGGDWDMDTDLKDNSFDDLVHFELRKK